MPPSPASRSFSRAAGRGALAVAAAGALALGACLAGCSEGGSSSSSSPGAATSASGFYGAPIPTVTQAPGFALRDQRGGTVTLAGRRGSVVVLAFLDSTCGANCVLVAQQIRGALDRLAAPVPVLMISADPAGDTPASVARFLAAVSLTGRVEYLSGPRGELARVWRGYRIAPARASGAPFEPAVSVLLLDRAGRERIAYGLEQLAPAPLASDIGRLEAG